jgi:hypothetical protein
VENIIALYAPLAGVVGLAFWSGVLTNKVANLKENHDNRLSKLEAHSDADTGVAVQMGVLTERITAMKTGQEKLDRDVQGIQRTLANMASGRTPPITKFEQD